MTRGGRGRGRGACSAAILFREGEEAERGPVGAARSFHVVAVRAVTGKV